MCSKGKEFQTNVLKITPWYCDDYMRQNLDTYAPSDNLENKTRRELKSEIEKLRWLLTRESISREGYMKIVRHLGYEYCGDCNKFRKME